MCLFENDKLKIVAALKYSLGGKSVAALLLEAKSHLGPLFKINIVR